MLNIHSSSDLDVLFDQFIKELKFPDDPLEPLWIITQNKETEQWLNLRMSDELGVSANIRFILPSEFLWSLYRTKDRSLKDELPSDKNAMIWAICELLIENRSLLPYHNSQNWSPQRYLDISSQLADVFDLYQNYRPEMLENWISGKGIPEDHAWQRLIWIELNKLWDNNKQWKMDPRRSEAFSDLIDWTRKGLLDNKIPSEIYVFGISQLNRPQLDLFCELSGRININLYSFEYVVENSESGYHEYLKKWTSVKTDQLNYLIARASERGIDIKSDRCSDELRMAEDLQIHSCHSPEREIEVIKNEILRALDNDHTLQLEDIIIMVPDPDLYGKLVHGIFTDPNRGIMIPVSDITSSDEPDAADSLRLLLKLFNSDYKSGWLSEVFNDPVLRTRFGMNEDDVFLLEKWLMESNVYHGFGEDFNSRYSWKKSLTQLMLGFIMHPSESELYEDVIPLDLISSGNESDILTGYSEFIRLTDKHRKTLLSEKNIQGWFNWLKNLFTDFFFHKGDSLFSSEKLLRLIDKLSLQSQYHTGNLKLPYNEFSMWFLKQLPGINARSGRFGQGITVSTYIPYRSVPFRWIGVLGMNEGSFPVSEVRPEFDLINADPEIGDRIQKEDDSLWFAETLAAARDTLFISYAGRDQKNDREMLPSIFVQQLLDQLNENVDYTRIRHPLHPFSQKYYSDEESYVSYDQYSAEILNKLNTSDLPPVFYPADELPDTEISDEIHFTELISFFKNPSKYFLKGHMGIDFRADKNQLKERENFEFDGLDKYLIDQKIYEFKMKGLDDNSILNYLKARDIISGDPFNVQLLSGELEIVNSLINEVKKEQKGDEISVDLDICISGLRIFGRLGGIYDDQLISYRIGRDNASVLIDHWIRYLLACCSDIQISGAKFLFKESSSADVQLHAHSTTGFENYLKDLAEWYLNRDHLADLNFFPDASRAYSEAILKGKVYEDALGKAEIQYEGSEYVRGEVNDFHVKTLWKGRDPVHDHAFPENALRFWEPFIKSIEDE